MLADKGVYLASESTFYRVLRHHGEVHHRGRRISIKPSRIKAPTTFTASGPCQVWTWTSPGCLQWYMVVGIICIRWKMCSAAGVA